MNPPKLVMLGLPAATTVDDGYHHSRAEMPLQSVRVRRGIATPELLGANLDHMPPGVRYPAVRSSIRNSITPILIPNIALHPDAYCQGRTTIAHPERPGKSIRLACINRIRRARLSWIASVSVPAASKPELRR